jgi:hypothetical protein
LPEWAIILLALGSAWSVRRGLGGLAKSLSRLWQVGFYAFLLFGPDTYSTPTMVVLSRWGLALIFAMDIIPELITWLKHRRGQTRHEYNR